MKVDFFIQFLDLEFRFIASVVVWDFFGAPTKILPPRYFLARYGPWWGPFSDERRLTVIDQFTPVVRAHAATPADEHGATYDQTIKSKT